MPLSANGQNHFINSYSIINVCYQGRTQFRARETGAAPAAYVCATCMQSTAPQRAGRHAQVGGVARASVINIEKCCVHLLTLLEAVKI